MHACIHVCGRRESTESESRQVFVFNRIAKSRLIAEEGLDR